jgi:hypothetical protein
MRGVVLEAGLGFWRAGLVQSSAEASGFLVVPLVFKTSEPRAARLAGSIPVRLRSPRASLRRFRRDRYRAGPGRRK